MAPPFTSHRTPDHAARAMKLSRVLAASLLALPLLIAPLAAQGDTSAMKPRHWYDTLQVTKPRVAAVTKAERLALSAFTALAIPVSIAVGVTTVIPPSVNILVEDGVPRAALAFSTGYGFGGDTSLFVFFPDFRVQLEYGYYFARSPRNRVALGLLVDKPIASIHRRDFFWFGVAGGGGLATDFTSYQPYLEGWIGIINPMGLRYVTLFPMHNYGIRGRVGYDVTLDRPWYELSLAATGTFW